MIQTFSAKTKSKTLYLKNGGGVMTAIYEKKARKGKKIYKLIDIAVGDLRLITENLKSGGYQVKIIK